MNSFCFVTITNSELEPATPDATLRDVINAAYACVMQLPGSEGSESVRKEDSYKDFVEQEVLVEKSWLSLQNFVVRRVVTSPHEATVSMLIEVRMKPSLHFLSSFIPEIILFQTGDPNFRSWIRIFLPLPKWSGCDPCNSLTTFSSLSSPPPSPRLV